MHRLICAAMLLLGTATPAHNPALAGMPALEPASASAPGPALLARLAAASTLRLTVDQSYRYGLRNFREYRPMAGYRLPLERLAADLLAGAGIAVVGEEAAAYDATLAIAANGLAMGRRYSQGVSGFLYSGARIDGEIVFSAPGLAGWRTRFLGRLRPLREITVNLGYEQPGNAPFAAALERPGSFVPRLMAAVGAVWGAPPLIAVLENGSVTVRRAAAFALGNLDNLGDVGAGAALLAALHERDAEVRRQAVWSLGRLGIVPAVPGLRAALHDANADVRWFAAWSLARITGVPLVDVLAGGAYSRKAAQAE